MRRKEVLGLNIAYQQRGEYGGRKDNVRGKKDFRGKKDKKDKDKNIQTIIENIVNNLNTKNFVEVIRIVENDLFKKDEDGKGGKRLVSDPQSKTALYKLMQTVKSFSKECLDHSTGPEKDSHRCSKAVAKIYASISAVASRRTSSTVFTVIKEVFRRYVVEGSENAGSLKERLDNFNVFLKVIVANAG